ncbi:MAG: ImmA/IrrE family metallo-endopeptidase [Clostridia bacterium]|nr:ImmA/IrrE family metallo-endopeptidase [Clostridia bacterium]MBQ2738464.1 ImmA/IrrE family metallo-endopeptidase [Clostridia bacterium]
MNYKLARDIAWRVLINNKVSSLPVDVFEICKAEGIFIFTYKSAEAILKELHIEEQNRDSDAFCFGRFIFYDDTKPLTRQRFSIAHELGHILLHLTDDKYDANRFRKVKDELPCRTDSTEAEANTFAARILAPLCVLQYLNVSSPDEIAELCDIGYTAARVRFERLCKIRARSAKRRREKGFGTFLIEGYERLVLDNFKDYIEKNKLPDKRKPSE